MIYNRLLPYTETIIGEYQAGFRGNRSTTDQIFVLRQIIEKKWEYAQEAHVIFIDFKQAYDCLHRDSLWRILESFNIPTKLIRMIRALYKETSSRVKVNGAYSDPFTIESGVRQGCLLSPCLFNLALEWVIRQLNAAGINIGPHNVAILAYADDIAMLGNNMAELEHSFETFWRAAEQIGLCVNENKTKIMHIHRGPQPPNGPEVVGGLTIEKVECFVYLGSEITINNDISGEINRRIGSATRAFYALNQLFKSRLLSRKLKLRLYTTVVLPVLTYGAETWSLTKQLSNKLLSSENNILKTICGPIFDPELGRWRRRYAREVREMTMMPLVTDLIRSSRLRWLGHVLRSGPNRDVYNIYTAVMEGRRPRGRPRKRWKDVVTEDLRMLEIDPNEVEIIARNRVQWKKIVAAAKGLNRPNAPGE